MFQPTLMEYEYVATATIIVLDFSPWLVFKQAERDEACVNHTATGLPGLRLITKS